MAFFYFCQLCFFKCALKWPAEAKNSKIGIAFVWLFSVVCFKMYLQIAWLRRGVVTLVAFVWLFSAIQFQMCSQMLCPRRGNATLFAFRWHSGEMLNKCNQCDYASSHPGHLWIHLKTHNGKSQTNATNVTLPLLRQTIWGHIWKKQWKYTVEKSQIIYWTNTHFAYEYHIKCMCNVHYQTSI